MKLLLITALMLAVVFLCFSLMWFGNLTARVIFG